MGRRPMPPNSIAVGEPAFAGVGSNLDCRKAMPLRPYLLPQNQKFPIHFLLYLIPATEEKTWPALSSRGQNCLNRSGYQSWLPRMLGR
jgi:hypothetical protein